LALAAEEVLTTESQRLQRKRREKRECVDEADVTGSLELFFSTYFSSVLFSVRLCGSVVNLFCGQSPRHR
jgi:hypothetical protein